MKEWSTQDCGATLDFDNVCMIRAEQLLARIESSIRVATRPYL